MTFRHRHLLGIEPLRPEEITTVLDLSEAVYVVTEAVSPTIVVAPSPPVRVSPGSRRRTVRARLALARR